MHILKPTFCQLPFGTYIILLFSYYEVQFSWQETVDMIGPHELNLLTWCRTKAFTTHANHHKRSTTEAFSAMQLRSSWSQWCNHFTVARRGTSMYIPKYCAANNTCKRNSSERYWALEAIQHLLWHPRKYWSSQPANIGRKNHSLHHFTFLFAISTNPMPCTDSQSSSICTCSKFLYQQINSHNLCAGWTAPPT